MLEARRVPLDIYESFRGTQYPSMRYTDRLGGALHWPRAVVQFPASDGGGGCAAARQFGDQPDAAGVDGVHCRAAVDVPHFGHPVLEEGLASRPAPAGDADLASSVVVDGQLLATLDVARGADPNGIPRDFDVAVGRAGMVDEARPVTTHRRIAQPSPIDPETPDSAPSLVIRLPAVGFVSTDLLARVVDDPRVLSNPLTCVDAPAGDGRPAADETPAGRGKQDTRCGHPSAVYLPRGRRGTSCGSTERPR